MSVAVLALFLALLAEEHIHTHTIMDRGILYLSCLLLVVFIQQGKVKLEVLNHFTGPDRKHRYYFI